MLYVIKKILNIEMWIAKDQHPSNALLSHAIKKAYRRNIIDENAR